MQRRSIKKSSDPFTIHISKPEGADERPLYFNVELRKNGKPVAGTTTDPNDEAAERAGRDLIARYIHASAIK